MNSYTDHYPPITPVWGPAKTSSYTDHVAPPLVPVPPAQAVAAGFSVLSFDEEFSSALDVGFGASGHKWNAGLWWQQSVPPVSDFLVRNGILTITNSTDPDGSYLATQYYDTAATDASGAYGTQFLGGYFEARMRCTDWSAFFLYCWDRPWVYGDLVLPSDPMSWTNEIDIIETDPGPNWSTYAFCTLHKNTGGDGGVPDEQNNPDYFPMPGGAQTIGQWHTYGVLWTQSAITWFVDDIQVASVPPYPSSWQPVQLVLAAQPGGVAGSPSSVTPPITQVAWVRVWTAGPGQAVRQRVGVSESDSYTSHFAPPMASS